MNRIRISRSGLVVVAMASALAAASVGSLMASTRLVPVPRASAWDIAPPDTLEDMFDLLHASGDGDAGEGSVLHARGEGDAGEGATVHTRGEGDAGEGSNLYARGEGDAGEGSVLYAHGEGDADEGPGFPV